jgi:hypothetical protein
LGDGTIVSLYIRDDDHDQRVLAMHLRSLAKSIGHPLLVTDDDLVPPDVVPVVGWGRTQMAASAQSADALRELDVQEFPMLRVATNIGLGVSATGITQIRERAPTILRSAILFKRAEYDHDLFEQLKHDMACPTTPTIPS